MSIQETSARRRSRLVVAPVVALALTSAVVVVAMQANSIRSTRIGPQVQGVPAQVDRDVVRHAAAGALALTADPNLRTSSHVSKRCWRRKFGCGQGATTAANPDLRTSSRVSKGCRRRKFACGRGATTTATRP